MERAESSTKYSLEWFQERAFSTLQKTQDGVWDYSDSLLLYTPGTEKEYESIQEGEDPYAQIVTKPEKVFLEKIAEDVVRKLPDKFEYIDLGPGTAHKEQYIFDAARRLGKTLIYRPVDISQKYLEMAAEYAKEQGIEVSPIRSEFEELPSKLNDSEMPRFVSLGLTFTNYEPGVILGILRGIAGESGYIFINTQVRDRVDMKKVVEIYSKDIRGLADPKIKLFGLDPEKDVSRRETNDGVEVWYTLKNSNQELEKKGVDAGDKLLMFRSLRYTKPAFEEIVASHSPSHQVFDTGNSFVGALLKPAKSRLPTP